ncbi:MAG: hypothetical protein RLZ97_763 [Verrucomicrobiota bacterium]
MDRCLHIVCGAPASGKSTYASALAREQGAVLLDSDMVAERLVRAGLSLAGMDPDDRDSPAYKSAFREVVYETLFDLAAVHLPYLGVVIAGPFTSEMARADWPDFLTCRFGIVPNLHWVHCPPDIRKARIEARGEPRDLPKLAHWETYLTTCREQPPVWNYLAINGADSRGPQHRLG